MEIIAAPADSEYLEEPKSLEEYAFNAGELSQIAAKLLRQMLELYGEFKLIRGALPIISTALKTMKNSPCQEKGQL